MKKILFLIHDLGQGGAEKVLVNLVNNLDKDKFNVTVISLFAGGVNEQFLKKSVRYKTVFSRSFPGNSKIMKLFTASQLHSLFIKESYDVEISFLEGPAARIISGCKNRNTKLVSWIHVEQHNMTKFAESFRTPKEALACYRRFHQTVCVSEYVRKDFTKLINEPINSIVLYNTVESNQILEKSSEKIEGNYIREGTNLIAVGSLKKSKGYERLLKIVKQLKAEGYKFTLHILGVGPLEQVLKSYVSANGLDDVVDFMGYKTNPYKYLASSDLFICSSFAEGFSTAATEALIVGTPVCTVEVSGMKEMLGENNEYGLVTDNNAKALYKGIKSLMDNPELLSKYKQAAISRGKLFSTEQTVHAVEDMFMNL